MKGVPSFALKRGKATLPRKPSSEETPMRRPTCLWEYVIFGVVFFKRTDQGLIHTRSFAKADGDAVEAKDGEVEHGQADSSKAEPMLGKELESSH